MVRASKDLLVENDPDGEVLVFGKRRMKTAPPRSDVSMDTLPPEQAVKALTAIRPNPVPSALVV